MDHFATQKLYSYTNNKPLNLICKFISKIKVQNREHIGEIYVVKGEGPALLKRESALKLDVLKIGLNINSIQLEERPVFKEIGKLKIFK